MTRDQSHFLKLTIGHFMGHRVALILAALVARLAGAAPALAHPA